MPRFLTASATATLCVLAAAAPASADEVGVVVTGDATLQPQLAAHLEGWLRDHGRRLVASPLDPDSINTMIDCFVIGDESCARNVVDKASRATNIVYARIEVSPHDAEGSRDITLVGYWLSKGSLHAIADRRTCSKCNERLLRGTADDLLTSLVHLAGPGTDPVPAPAPAAVSAATLPPLAHEAPITGDGEMNPDHTHSYVLFGAGGAVALAGITMIAMGEQTPGKTGPQDPTYRDYGPPGYALALVGLGAVGAGVYLYFREGAHSAPVAALAPGGGYVGWTGSF